MKDALIMGLLMGGSLAIIGFIIQGLTKGFTLCVSKVTGVYQINDDLNFWLNFVKELYRKGEAKHIDSMETELIVKNLKANVLSDIIQCSIIEIRKEIDNREQAENVLSNIIKEYTKEFGFISDQIKNDELKIIIQKSILAEKGL